MAVEEVDIVELHALERLVERGHEVLARAPVAVGAGPHVVAGLGGDEHFVAVGLEVFLHEPAEGQFGGTVWGAVVVGQVEVGDAVVEGIAHDFAATGEIVFGTKVMPHAQGHLGQKDARAPATFILQHVVALGGSNVVFHGYWV